MFGFRRIQSCMLPCACRLDGLLVLDAIIVIAQYARDQAVVSARDQALACLSIAAPYGSQRTHYLSGVF